VQVAESDHLASLQGKGFGGRVMDRVEATAIGEGFEAGMLLLWTIESVAQKSAARYEANGMVMPRVSFFFMN